MATDKQIAAYDRLLNLLSKRMQDQLNSLFADVLVSVAALGVAPSRIQLQQLFGGVNQFIQSQSTAIQQIIAADVALNAQVIDPQQWPLPAETNQLITEAITVAQQAAQDQQNELIKAMIIGGIIGTATSVLVRQARSWVKRSSERITRNWITAVTQTTAAILKIRAAAAGVDKFRYVGGVIETSRPFCRTHNGKTYTLKEIDKIAAGSWQGKEPGNIFLTRGGYNCRHFWVAVP